MLKRTLLRGRPRIVILVGRVVSALTAAALTRILAADRAVSAIAASRPMATRRIRGSAKDAVATRSVTAMNDLRSSGPSLVQLDAGNPMTMRCRICHEDYDVPNPMIDMQASVDAMHAHINAHPDELKTPMPHVQPKRDWVGDRSRRR